MSGITVLTDGLIKRYRVKAQAYVTYLSTLGSKEMSYARMNFNREGQCVFAAEE
jgi:hypothetical protein